MYVLLYSLNPYKRSFFKTWLISLQLYVFFKIWIICIHIAYTDCFSRAHSNYSDLSERFKRYAVPRGGHWQHHRVLYSPRFFLLPFVPKPRWWAWLEKNRRTCAGNRRNHTYSYVPHIYIYVSHIININYYFLNIVMCGCVYFLINHFILKTPKCTPQLKYFLLFKRKRHVYLSTLTFSSKVNKSAST